MNTTHVRWKISQLNVLVHLEYTSKWVNQHTFYCIKLDTKTTECMCIKKYSKGDPGYRLNMVNGVVVLYIFWACHIAVSKFPYDQGLQGNIRIPRKYLVPSHLGIRWLPRCTNQWPLGSPKGWRAACILYPTNGAPKREGEDPPPPSRRYVVPVGQMSRLKKCHQIGVGVP